jgi:hypothetical protein
VQRARPGSCSAPAALSDFPPHPLTPSALASCDAGQHESLDAEPLHDDTDQSLDRRATLAPRRTLRPKSVDARRFAIRQAAGILVRFGVVIEDLHLLRDLVEPIERVEIILEFLAERYASKHDLPAGAEMRGGQVAQVAETFGATAVVQAAAIQAVDGYLAGKGIVDGAARAWALVISGGAITCATGAALAAFGLLRVG